MFLFFLSFVVPANLTAKAALNGKGNLAIWWGQNSGGTQESQTRLKNYCTEYVDIVILSFLIQFGKGQQYLVNFANQAGGQTVGGDGLGSALYDLPQIAEDIQYCQAQGKQVLLSLGGASGNYAFSDEADARKVAQDLHNIFGLGSSSQRPFHDSVIDGYDLDIEGGSPTGYAAFIDEIRSLEPKVLISGAPQCPFPDAYVGNALDNAVFDYVFIQFYNNYCNAGTSNVNWDADWANWASKTSKNRNVKIFLATPAGSGAAGSGYLGWDSLQEAYDKIKLTDNLGGIALWDASVAFTNTNGGQNYAQFAKKVAGTLG